MHARFVPRATTLLILAAIAGPGRAEEAAVRLEEVEVTAARPGAPTLNQTELDDQEMARLRPATSDTASLLRTVPGVSLYGAGGVSSLPVIHGLADDRLRTQLDGMDLIAACPNHMNPTLSYLDPTAVASVKVYPGVTPVSVGGDSLGGAILVESAQPKFAQPGQGLLATGQVGGFYRSNGDAKGANARVTLASEMLSLTYTGATAQSDNYKAGGDFKAFTTETGRPGHTLAADEVGSSAYETRNQSVLLAVKRGGHLLEAKFDYQDIPYELYPNQRMDMLGNQAHGLNLHYLGQLDWGELDARVYHQKVNHYMDFGADKKFTYGAAPGLVAPGMPMYTEGKTDGATAKLAIPVNDRDQVRVGMELQKYRLDDWWPPSPDCGVGVCVGGMAPLTFWNINGGERDRAGVFGEWEAKWSPQWLSLLGLRFDRVKSDTGAVVGYNTSTTPLNTGFMQYMYETSSVGSRADFNNMDRKRTDHNLDLSLLARNTPDANRSFEFGVARKTRSPNLYERYSWSRNAMALEMNNFVGDGNGYLGNPDLKPEVAHTLNVSAEWRAPDGSWEFRAVPYYSHVKDYIDAVQWNRTSNLPAQPPETDKFVMLKYMNQSARLYGLDLSGRLSLGVTRYGAWGVEGIVNYTDGKNLDTDDGLYNIMPLNATLTLTHKIGGWDNRVELVTVAGKHDVSDTRNEMQTSGYSLVNLRVSHAWKRARLDFGVENLFDRMYDLPLGGAYTGQGATMSFNREVGTLGPGGGDTSLWGTPVPGPGRSFYTSLSYTF